MPKKSRTHGSEEFGRPGSSSISGLDAPMFGASSSIMVDALVERESGVTPPPPLISVKAIVIGLAVMFVIGVIGASLLLRTLPSKPAYGGSLPGASNEDANWTAPALD